MVLLVYNLATLATSSPESFESDTFLRALIAYINSFIVVFFYWSRFILLLEGKRSLDDTIITLSLLFLIIVALIPVSYILLLQLKSQKALIFSCIVRILAGSLLILLGWTLVKSEIFVIRAGYFFLQVSLIPVIYTVALFVSYLNFTLAAIIPLSFIPLYLGIRRRYQKFM